MVGLTPPPHDWVGNDGKPIYFDSIDNSDYILGKSPHSARNSWIYTTYNLTMDPYEKYDMTFNGAAPTRTLTSSPGRYAGQDNGWVLSLIEPVIIDFDKTLVQYPNIKRSPGGASNDVVPNLQTPDNPVPLLKDTLDKVHVGGGGG
jgi:hypothetical protein